MSDSIADLKRRLARDAEAICRHYLSGGRRCGRYWVVGDLANTPGRSLYVRLHGPEHGHGAVGQWTDACTQEHGDLLDLIAGARRLGNMRETLAEARRFLNAPRPDPPPCPALALAGSPEAARRLIAMAAPIRGTIAEAISGAAVSPYLQKVPALRFHPGAIYRADNGRARECWPALLAAVTDAAGMITGVHRTWLARDGAGKAPITTPRRAMGQLLGNGVRFGAVRDVLAAGEGIETVLSLRCVLPRLPMIAALSANHLAALMFPASLRRLYICAILCATTMTPDGGRPRAWPRAPKAQASKRSRSRRPRAISTMISGWSAAPAWRAPCARNSRQTMSRASYGVDRPGLDRRASAVSSAAPLMVPPCRDRRRAVAFERAIRPEAARSRNGGAACSDAAQPPQTGAKMATAAAISPPMWPAPSYSAGFQVHIGRATPMIWTSLTGPKYRLSNE